ncbi:MAG: hypothetical protein ABIP34_10280 [Rhodoferax sp.]|uniref:hypothetical protein n=1 Tax=Rhodoferax sp. TaxID=50421 RepID=UPI0032665974
MRNLLFSASVLVCVAAWAQSPAGPYRSVFADTPTGMESQSLDWRRANADVAQKALEAEMPHANRVPSTNIHLPVLAIEDAVAIARQNHPSQSAADTRKAWIHAVAAQQAALFVRDAKDAAEAGAELARRMAQVGNWSSLEQAREQLMLADATAQLARANNTAFSTREQLIRQMGMDGAASDFALPDHLPDLPRAADLRVLPAQSRSETREAYFAYRTAFDLAVHYRDDIVPLRKLLVEELVLRYNGMLASVWELLAETRQQSLSVNSAIEAQRDFWLADADLQTAQTLTLQRK